MSIDNIRNTRRTKRWLYFIITIAAAASIFISMKYAHSADKAEVPFAAALTVQGVLATTASWPDIVEASGPIAAWQEAIIGSEISGQRLVEVRVNVGDRVKKGQVLARYNSETLKAEKAELQATWQQSESNSKRAETLKGSGALSAQQIENYKNQAAIDKARLDAKNLELNYVTVVAPDDGTISSRTATLGTIGNNGTELFRMILNDRIEWRGELSAQQLKQVKVGQGVEVSLPDGTKAKAKIRQLSPSLDTTSRMATLYADILPGSSAHAGMYAKGIIAMQMRPAIVIPAISVVIRDGRSYVFELSGDGLSKVTQQAVVTGRTQGSEVEITEGLKEGAHVVTQGAGFLNDGDMVRLVNNTGEPQ